MNSKKQTVQASPDMLQNPRTSLIKNEEGSAFGYGAVAVYRKSLE